MSTDVVERLEVWIQSMGIVLVSGVIVDGDEHLVPAKGPRRDLLDARDEIVRLRTKPAADSEAVDRVRKHVARKEGLKQAAFSIAGLKSVLAELDTLKASEGVAFKRGVAACVDSLGVWRENLDSRHDASLIEIFEEAVGYLDGVVPEFNPGFEHAEGGKYELIGPGQVKMTSADVWRPAYFYVNDKGERFATGPERWVDRFKLAVR